jgi:release factor glutamine methyltransferase
VHLQLSVSPSGRTLQYEAVDAVTAEWQALLREAKQALTEVAESPQAEAEWLLSEQLGIDRSQLRVMPRAPTHAERQQFARALARRAAGEPFAYVAGTQPFRCLQLQVTPAVLIPRADTELLVEWTLEILRGMAKPARVMDACTGSGCVALALADEAPGHRYWASDCSAEALAVAQGNAQRFKLDVQFVMADALQWNVELPSFDVITANPPYIAADDPHLPALRHEPKLALVSGDDGLPLLRRLIAQAPEKLLPNGCLLLEHGYDQAPAVQQLLKAAGFSQVTTRHDLGGNPRVTAGYWAVSHD